MSDPRTLLDFFTSSEGLKTELRPSWPSNGRQESVAEHGGPGDARTCKPFLAGARPGSRSIKGHNGCRGARAGLRVVASAA
ncbi:MAG: hypothetical protein K0S96_2087 [Geminicoccaceae bacterium]|nr:hypothetical protein [Geminicoccaceae bacterium]MDF2782282.1 hypothetical protein [Geminicoccaceae bacterium]